MQRPGGRFCRGAAADPPAAARDPFGRARLGADHQRL